MDIDIDISPKFKSEAIFPNAPRASTVENGELKKHLVGLYFQNVPVDRITGLTAIPYKDAESHGLFKIDILTVNILGDFDIFDSKEQMRQLTKVPPDWKLLENEEIVKHLFHLSKHAEVVTKIKPKSVSELADCLALIRPDKRHLIDKYISNRTEAEVQQELYTKREKSDLRKSHAIPYALLIVLQLHLIKEGIYEI